MSVSVSNQPQLEASWLRVLQNEFQLPYFGQLKSFLVNERSQHIVYPPGPLIFNALNTTPFDQVKVVILGQDPYHGPNQAHGLSFSVPEGIQQPPSLVNIFKEIKASMDIEMSSSGNLTSWAEQGVLLLNATLTVRAHQAGSHQNQGWESFTDKIIESLALQREGIVFMLWGSYAQRKGSIINPGKHLVLKAPHPSPLSAYRGFFGCNHFVQANEYLIKQGHAPIDWKI